MLKMAGCEIDQWNSWTSGTDDSMQKTAVIGSNQTHLQCRVLSNTAPRCRSTCVVNQHHGAAERIKLCLPACSSAPMP